MSNPRAVGVREISESAQIARGNGGSFKRLPAS